VSDLAAAIDAVATADYGHVKSFIRGRSKSWVIAAETACDPKTL
jgi:hypothetical protein